jgi:hypothetical protein
LDIRIGVVRVQLVHGVCGVTLIGDVHAVGLEVVSGAPVERIDDLLLTPSVLVGSDLLALELRLKAGEPISVAFSY